MSGEFQGREIANKYEVGKLLRRSDLGDLYAGRHVFMDRPVTLRLVPRALASDDEVVRRFFEEAKQLAKVSHPNVVSISDFGSADDGVVYAVYEELSGETLSDLTGQLDAYSAIDITRQTAHGLSAIHSKDTRHGNLIPENVFVAKNADDVTYTAKIFGIGSEGPLSPARSENEFVTAEVAYLAPEQCAGSENVDHRGDIYSLGVIGYELLAGEPPFSGDRPAEVMARQTEEPPPPLSSFRNDLPAGIESTLLKALAKDPDLRYQSAEEFANDLAGAAARSPLPVAVGAAVGGDANNIWKTAFVVLAGITLLSIALIYATSSRMTDPETVLQSDANGVPVQPLNPATGAEEQNLELMPEMLSNSNTASPTDTLPGGDGYNPWATGAPPAGAPPQTYTGPPTGTVNVPPGQSPFMQEIPAGCSVTPSGLILCPVTPTPTPRQTPTPRPPVNANVATPPTPNEPRPTPQPARPTPTPARPAGTPSAERPSTP